MAVPDYLFPTNNEMEIPMLDSTMQAEALTLPIVAWGQMARSRCKASTMLFYVDDYRFSSLWNHPELPPSVTAATEPNYSLHDETPLAWGVQGIYRKRWLARYWQMQGVKIWVDLFVAPKFCKWNLLGVPEGWNAFFTRGESLRPWRVEEDWKVARHVSGRAWPNMAVYGGGEEVKRICQRLGMVYVENAMRHYLITDNRNV